MVSIFSALALRLRTATTVGVATLLSLAIIGPLSGCHGTPVLSSSHRPDNIYDVALIEGAAGNDEEVAERLLSERYPPGSDAQALISYLKRIGAECKSEVASLQVCQTSSFLEEKSAFWIFNTQLTEGETLSLWEYKYTTILESAGNRIKSIDVTRVAARLK